MKVMPCLYNRWHDSRFDYGGTYMINIRQDWTPQLEYVRALVAPLANDPVVLIWDLCNEPQCATGANTAEETALEVRWLSTVAQWVREAGARQPITIGTMFAANIEATAAACDVLCGHPYVREAAGLPPVIAESAALRQKHGKPFLVNECIPGCFDDQKRADLARAYVDQLSAAGFGWMGWALREGKAISTRAAIVWMGTESQRRLPSLLSPRRVACVPAWSSP